MSTFRALHRALMRAEARDLSTVVLLLVTPVILLVLLTAVLGLDDGSGSTNTLAAGTITMTVSFSALCSGVTHILAWRMNGVLGLMRTFPISNGALLTAQALTGLVLAAAQVGLLLIIVDLPTKGLDITSRSSAAIAPIVLGYFAFFMLGVLVANLTRSIATSAALAILVFALLLYGGAVIYPIDQLPSAWHTLAPFSPFYQFHESVSVSLSGVLDWSGLARSLAALAALAAVLFVAGRTALRWDTRSA